MSTIDFDLVDVPVEFKKITPDDFNNEFYKSTIEFINPDNETGFIYDELMPILKRDLEIKNTTVINAGTGQGKSKCLIEIVKEYINKNEYVIVFALPFKSLIQQYFNQCKDIIDEKRIFSLLDIEENELIVDFTNKPLFDINDDDIVNQYKQLSHKIHILTVNALLGNSGEDYIFQSGKRKIYFEKLYRYCSNNNKKVILIFDEIHDSIKNFKEEYIFNLWNFKSIIHKNYIVSATFNEASKEVIKYLSEFTEKTINIIESKRVIIPKNQGKLHLIINQDKKAFLKNEVLRNVIKKSIDKNKSIDIIVYAKSQVENIENGDYLKDIINDNFNFCYSVGYNSSNFKKYIEGKINVGTNFHTGINIEDENHTLILVLPKRQNEKNNKTKGIFSNGINSFLQAIARQRKKGDIYVIMSEPFGLKNKSLPFKPETNNQIVKILNDYRTFNSIDYSDINLQKKILDKTYNDLLKNTEKASENFKNSERKGMNSLQYPSKEQFILSKGEKYLAEKYFEGDISTTVFYLAITNQISNCKLISINHNKAIQFTTKNLDNEIFITFYDFIKEENMPVKSLNVFYYKDDDFEDDIYTKISINSGYSIFKNLMDFLSSRTVMLDGDKIDNKTLKNIKSRYLSLLLGLTSEVNEKDLKVLYFKSCVSQVSNLELSNTGITFSNKLSNFYYIHYKKWLVFIEIINNSIIINGKKSLLDKFPDKIFIETFKSLNMFEEINYLIMNDEIIKLNFFPYNDSFKRISDIVKAANYYYKSLIEIFFKISDTDFQSSTDKGKRYYIVQEPFSEENLRKEFYTNMLFSSTEIVENIF
jgi:hypothetical protein